MVNIQEQKAADGMSYRNAAEDIAKVAAQSQSDDINATISKSPLVSGATACWSERLDRDGFAEGCANARSVLYCSRLPAPA
jgi:hypothetical protein